MKAPFAPGVIDDCADRHQARPRSAPRRRLADAPALLLAGALVWSAPALAQNRLAAVATNSVKQVYSVFNDDPRVGKDPFFPKSTRRDASVPTASRGNVASSLVLKGLSGGPEKRLAIINNYTLAVGEEAEIRIEGQIVRLQCVEIRDRSVLVRCNGLATVRELLLRQNL